jgi:hypothetical protein
MLFGWVIHPGGLRSRKAIELGVPNSMRVLRRFERISLLR